MRKLDVAFRAAAAAAAAARLDSHSHALMLRHVVESTLSIFAQDA